MKIFTTLIFLIAGCIFFESCTGAPGYNIEGEGYGAGIRIAWDYSSMQKLAPAGKRKLSWVGYPRVRRLTDGSILAIYETGGEVETVRSRNNGVSWEEPVVVFEQQRHTNDQGTATEIRAANPELYQLQNGELVAACNYRPVKHEIAPFSIAVKRSTDNGYTWSESRIIYEAEPRFRDGCWEPAFLQLPGGELQVYFANEAPYTHSNEQEISMISSNDNGKSWGEEVKTVSFRAGRRDGMPVPLLVDDEIIVAIEDNKVEPFKPYIVRNLVAENWKTPVDGNSQNREYALKDSLPVHAYGGAPYLMRVPSGEVVMSYQTTFQRSSNWEMSTMEVAVGDKNGRNFDRVTRPFDVPLDREAKWNSISLWDEKTIVAASTTSFRSKSCEVWIILGKILPEIKLFPKAITVDGLLDEWDHELPVFIGSRSNTNLSAALGFDAQNLYFCADVKDDQLIYDAEKPQESDGVVLYFEPEHNNQKITGHEEYRIFCSSKKAVTFQEKKKGEWRNLTTEGVIAEVKTNGGKGYQIEVALPLEKGFLDRASGIRFTMELVEKTGNGEGYAEPIVHTLPDIPQTWLTAPFVKLKDAGNAPKTKY